MDQYQQMNMNTMMVTTEAVEGRVPQWSLEETRELLAMRGELDQSFLETKRNKLLWEVIATTMTEKGFNRTPDQCKCKWKNLVTRYKGCETMDPEAASQLFPFHKELQAIFSARMQRMLWSETTNISNPSTSTWNKTTLSSSDEEEHANPETYEGKPPRKKKKKKKGQSGIKSLNNSGGLKTFLEELLKQQEEMEARWMNACETLEQERRMRENEWRNRMQAMENERVMMERRWREKEEQWRSRQEARAQRSDALITALLNNFTH